ncbi:MAG: PilZ domain-containing protein [Bdellovibrionales bacterium]|nr:PilZ domain-containing protein [Bdellovibrionales bacterium]
MDSKRNSERWDIRIIGEFDSVNHEQKIKLVFLDVSSDGFRAYSEGEIALHQSYLIEVRLINGDGIKVKASAVWQTEDNVFGFKVSESSVDWIKLVEDLAKFFHKSAA